MTDKRIKTTERFRIMMPTTLFILTLLAGAASAAFHVPCPSTPPPGCGVTRAATLTMRITLLGPAVPGRTWEFIPKTTFRWDGAGGGFGDPTTGETAFTACLYDEMGLAWQGVTFAQVSLWDFPVFAPGDIEPSGVLQRESLAWKASLSPTRERHVYFHRGGPWGVGPITVEQGRGRQTIRATGPSGSYAALPANPTGAAGEFHQQPGGGVLGTPLRPPPYVGAVTYTLIAAESGVPGTRCWGTTFEVPQQNDAKGYRARVQE